MKSFHSLTERGQMGRLLKLAQVALAQFDVPVREVKPLVKSTNALFLVHCHDASRYVMRVCEPGEHDMRDHEAECLWLDALARDTALPVPHIIKTRSGQIVAEAGSAGVPETRMCMLFSHLPGKPMDELDLDEGTMSALFEQLGMLAAQLHTHAETFALPEALQPMRWDKAFYYPHEPVVVFEPAHEHLFGPGQRNTLQLAQQRVDALLADWFATGKPMLIHGDLHTGNVHVDEDKLYVLDFEDLMWGFPAQDIAVTLYSVWTNKHYPALQAAFQRGYERCRAWPITSDEHILETLFLARMLMFINYCINRIADPEMAPWVPKLMQRVERVMQGT